MKYSFGETATLQIDLNPRIAESYNEAVRALQRAQQRFFDIYGRDFDPIHDLLGIDWTRQQRKAYNYVAKTINKIIDSAGGSIPAESIVDDFLVPVTALVVKHATIQKATKPSKILSFAVAAGVVYGIYLGAKNR